MDTGMISYALLEGSYTDPQRIAGHLHDVRTYRPRFI